MNKIKIIFRDCNDEPKIKEGTFIEETPYYLKIKRSSNKKTEWIPKERIIRVEEE